MRAHAVALALALALAMPNRAVNANASVSSPDSKAAVPVWDLPVRVFHRPLVAAFFGVWSSGEEDGAGRLHLLSDWRLANNRARPVGSLRGLPAQAMMNASPKTTNERPHAHPHC